MRPSNPGGEFFSSDHFISHQFEFTLGGYEVKDEWKINVPACPNV